MKLFEESLNERMLLKVDQFRFYFLKTLAVRGIFIDIKKKSYI